MDRRHLHRNKMKPELQAYLDSLHPQKRQIIETAIVQETCNVDELNNFFTQMNIASTKSEKDVMSDLENVMKGLEISNGGNGSKDESTSVNTRKRGIGDVAADPATEGLALLITAIEQLPRNQTEPTNQNKLFGYATQFYNKFFTSVNICIQYVWNDTLKDSLISYIIGKLTFLVLYNPGYIVSFITTLSTIIIPFMSVGTGISSTVALGTIIKKVFGHLAAISTAAGTDSLQQLVDLNTRIQGMSNAAVVEELKNQSSKLSNATANLIQSLQKTDYDALANILPEIKNKLNEKEGPHFAEITLGINSAAAAAATDAAAAAATAGDAATTPATVYATAPAADTMEVEQQQRQTAGSGKRKSKKRQTKNKKNKARKTKKNKRSSKKKAYKKK